MATTGRELADFWDRRADDYPRFGEEPDGPQARIVELARRLGVEFKGRRVLDVGSGTGLIAVAAEAAEVTALDPSGAMLEASRRDCLRRGLENVRHVRSEWSAYEPPGRFDVVLCPPCPAAADDAGKEKLIGATGGTLVYVGFADHVHAKPLADLLADYGVAKQIFRTAADLADWLGARSLAFERAPLRGRWTSRRSPGQARGWCAMTLVDHGVADPDPGLVDRRLAPFWDEAAQNYAIEAPYSFEMIIWRR